MRLTVLSVAFPFAPIGPEAVGGAERILTCLDEALTAAGHVSLVVACEGSRPAGTLFPVPLPEGDLSEEADGNACVRSCQAAIDRALATHRVDVIHLHGMEIDQYVLPETVPVVVTLHLPIACYRAAVWTSHPGHIQFSCVSESQRRSCPPGLHGCNVIENGVALPYPREAPLRQEFALVMGRICPEKNAHAALEAGALAGVPVVIAGRAFPYREHQRYLRDKIEPLLNRDHSGIRHTFLGPVSLGQQQRLMTQARCLLHPTLAPETSSLVAMEALAAGTPVISYRSGALPEIVEDNVTGFLVNDVGEMDEAMHKIHTISRDACRRIAGGRFNLERMVREYFDLYKACLRQRQREPLYA
jgi:glycosyltransferase involved in cell wall biosynthesis